jgi:DNA-binding NarL/FixJ family response regulator
MSLRILVVDDHALMRRGVRSLLERHQGWEVCGEAGSGPAAVAQSLLLRPDVVIMDIGLPEMTGLDATRQILKAVPGIDVLVLTMHDYEDLESEILGAGARGYVLKTDAEESLVAAVDRLGPRETFR